MRRENKGTGDSLGVTVWRAQGEVKSGTLNLDIGSNSSGVGTLHLTNEGPFILSASSSHSSRLEMRLKGLLST
jgi:hypothetical protein